MNMSSKLPLLLLLQALHLYVYLTITLTALSSTEALSTSVNDVIIQNGNRRGFLSKAWKNTVLPVAFAASSSFSSSRIAYADVSDGTSLPEGALQFSRAVKARSDWDAIGQTVDSRGKEMSKDEWEGVMSFLRKLYSVGEDMKGIAKGMDVGKKKQAEALIGEFQTIVKTADGAARGQDREAFMILYKKSAVCLDDFFALLQDVPDEI